MPEIYCPLMNCIWYAKSKCTNHSICLTGDCKEELDCSEFSEILNPVIPTKEKDRFFDPKEEE